MKNFLAIYLGSAAALESWRHLNADKRDELEKQGIEAWMNWAKENHSSIVDMGSPVGKTKRVDKNGISDIRNEIGAYTIVRAESHEAAAKLFENHPHFMLFPGESVEIMECLPLPR